MGKIWTEEEVGLEALAQHMWDAGLASVTADEGRLLLHTASGVGYVITLDDQRKFVRLSTCLPLDPDQPEALKQAFAHQLNADVFLPSFSIDEAGGLRISYALPYGHGLIAGQFMSIVHRFGSLLEYLLATHNAAGLITLGAKRDRTESDSHPLDNVSRDEGMLLN